jgi:hypothetical protein
MVGLRHSGPAPIEEVPIQVLSGLPIVLLEQRHRVTPPAKHEGRSQPADTRTDHRNPRHRSPLRVVLRNEPSAVTGNDHRVGADWSRAGWM